MENNPPNDFAALAQELNIPADKIRNTLDLLSQGNTVPFIARFRKDETGGLENDQIRLLQQRAAKIKALSDRKATILKTIRSQNKLTPELEASIQAADAAKLLEDLYLPFKPRKQTLASQARHNGLEPLAEEILAAGEMNLEERAAEFAGEDKKVATAEEALQGASHIIAEGYSEQAELRQKLRTMLTETGRILCSRFEETEAKNNTGQQADENASTAEKEQPGDATGDAPTAAEPSDAAAQAESKTESAPAEPASETSPAQEQPAATVTPAEEPVSEEPVKEEPAAETTATGGDEGEASTPEAATPEASTPEAATPEATTQQSDEPAAGTPEPPATEAAAADEPSTAASAETSTEDSPQPTADSTTEAAPESQPATDGVVSQDESAATVEATQPPAATAESTPATDETKTDAAALKSAADSEQAKQAAKEAKKKKAAEKKAAAREKKAAAAKKQKQDAKRKKRARLEASFKDYFKFNEPISKLPPHRILAINRGERVRILKVKFEYDTAAMQQAAIDLVVPAEHPRRDMLVAAARDAVSRLVMPALEREVRRELTEQSEVHAVEVFARNLRKLLLQPPVRNKRVLAIDPGFRSGCKLTALDEFGAVLGYAIIHVIGREDRCRHGRAKLVELINQHKIDVIAIGNGAACRETEQLVASVIADELKETSVRYTIVNEAGASVYSTSAIGREELPTYDETLRSAVSIGRRLIDPLSELVKINPSNIGVGMYQHDVKATHLRDTLDGVVEACVNYVGVDVNSASPALLRYVSGMNQLTARRVYEHRQNNGPFKTREELKQVAGLGDQTFQQAAGFLRIPGGDNPLDSTWIHPESYDAACKVLEKLDASVEQLALPVEPKAKQKFGGELIEDEPAEATADTPATAPEETSSEATEPPAENAEAAPAAEEPAVTSEGETPAEETPAAAPEAEAAAESAAETASASLPAEPPAEAEKEQPAAEEPSAHSQAIANRAKLLAELAAKADGLDTAKLAAELNIGELLLRDLLADLVRPGRDPREDLPAPDFRRGIMKLEDLEAGMQLSGTVLNVVDFGAFVDIGLSDSGLIHISRLAGHYISDPHDVVSVGDIVTVWVVEVDVNRRRVSLTAIKPGSEPKRERPPRQKRPSRKPAAQSGDKPPRSGGGKRPPRGDRRGKDNRRGGGGRSYTPKKPPKPVTPITKAMEEGSEPMRSFSDLKQLFEKKKDDGKKK